jgi:uncharacterized protein YdhG (YjbR/CyaY superfamily)
MQSRAQTVTEYMREVPAGHLDALTELREICVQSLPGFKESMEYGSPCYNKDGQAEVAWQSHKKGISLFIKDETILKKFKSIHKSYDIGKNNIHFKGPENIKYSLISDLLEEVANSKQEPFI